MQQDANFLRRQREKREAQKKALSLQTGMPAKPLITPQTRQQAIDAHVQELLNKQAPPPPPEFPVDAENT